MRDDMDIPTPGYRVGHRRAGIDPATRRLSLIAATIGGALVVLVGIWSMVGGGSAGVPLVPAPPGPMRVKPANPGGMQVAGASDKILGGSSGTSTTAALAPPPETPDLSALQNPPPAAAPAPVHPAVAVAAPAPAPVAAPTRIAANGLPLPPPAPPPLQLAAASAVVPPPADAGTGPATQVQLAALSSEQSALHAWQHLQTSFPALFGSRQPLVEKVQVDGHTFWRLRTGGFANIAEATHFCAAVRAAGSGCTIAAF